MHQFGRSGCQVIPSDSTSFSISTEEVNAISCHDLRPDLGNRRLYIEEGSVGLNKQEKWICACMEKAGSQAG